MPKGSILGNDCLKTINFTVSNQFKMKALKAILSVIGVILLIYLVLCIAGPKNMNVNRTISIDAPASFVYNQFANLKQWEKWSSWAKADPDMKYVYNGPPVGKGSSYSWDGPKSGKGNLEIVDATPGKSMKTKMKFDGFDGFSYGSWNISDKGSGTQELSWGMESDTPLPFMARGMMMVMGARKKLAGQFDEGLAGIRTLAQDSYAQAKAAAETEKKVLEAQAEE